MTTLTPALTELASWTLATEVMRRAPELLRIIETHPGGGQYDCLSMVRIVPHLLCVRLTASEVSLLSELSIPILLEPIVGPK